MRKLDKLVAEAMRNAAENGYDYETGSSREIADDMLDCDADISNFHPIDVAYAVLRYRQRHSDYRPKRSARRHLPSTSSSRVRAFGSG